MNKDIRELIETLKRGKYEDPGEKIDLLAAALKDQGGADVPLLLSLLDAPQVPLKLAAIEACRERPEKELADKVRELSKEKDYRVKVKVAAVLPDLPPDDEKDVAVISKLVEDESYEVRSQAIRATTGKEHFVKIQRGLLANDPAGWVRLMASLALSENASPEFVTDFFVRFANDDFDDLQIKCAEIVEKLMTDSMKQCEPFLPTDIMLLQKAGEVLQEYKLTRLSRLTKWISEKTKSQVNPRELEKYGTDLTASAIARTLPHAFGVDDICDKIIKVIVSKEPRSVVLLGETGVGKSAVVNELVYRLTKLDNSWHVLRVSPTEFLADTKYVGEWQTRVAKLVELISKPRRVLLYIPKLSDLTGVGRYEGSQADVANALAPHIEDGSILVIGESTPDEYERGLGGIPALRRLFNTVLVHEPSPDATRDILAKVRDENKTNIPDAGLNYLVEISGQYLNQSSRPGNAVALLREVIAAHANQAEPVTNRMILDTVSKSTGIPSEFLDDSIPLDLNAVKAFFENRVMGQPEAVEAVLDLITLIKAGLTDPGKPFGVMLFVGPTGVGKTELARALAEFVFGDVGRLQRFDMSEFASYEGYERLIGVGKGPGLLTSAIRRTPFSVVLLDEIEKSHVNVYDLCLQIFDAGRLTDGKGKTVNFRQTIVILTSNVGATSSGGVLGFGAPGQAPPKQQADKERTFRELARVFRPEFLNRIDRIINFRPLTLQITESIARREINLVLERSGIARRNIVVDVDPSVIALLVKEGYSPNFGARPLKRAVERSLLLPLARSIATGRIGEKTVLRAAAAANKIEFKVVSKPAETVIPKEEKREEPLLEIAAELMDEYDALDNEIEPLNLRKTELLEESRQPGFYQDRLKMSATFDEIHRLDQFLSVYEGLGKAIGGIYARVSRKVAKGEEDALAERLQQLGDELEHIRFIATSDDPHDLSDALLVVSLIDREGEPLDGVEKLIKMYSSFARRRRLTPEVVSEFITDKENSVHLHITGMGSFMFYKNEIGLHQLDSKYREKTPRSGKERHLEDREVVRVDVYPVDGQADKSFAAKVKITVNPSKGKPTRYLTSACCDVSAFHEPSLRSFRGLVAGEKEEAINRAQQILYALTKNGPPPPSAQDEIVRQYELGIGAKVKDTRTGKVTTRVERVLKGHLEPFLSSTDRDDEE